MSVRNTVKSIQDIMRQDVGVDGDAQRISQLCWMFFLKIIDDQDQQLELMRDGYRSPLPKRLQWHTWAANPEGITGDELVTFINSDLFPTLKSLPLGKQGDRRRVVRDVFEDAYNYMKSGQLMRQVINKISAVDFNNLAERQHFGDIYEQILTDLQSAGNAGEYYTPRAVTSFMVARLDPHPGELLFDPACGTGGFLTCAIRHMRDRYVKKVEHEQKMQSALRAVEKKQLPHMLCVTNMLLHSIEDPSFVRHDNTLARPYISYTASDRVDIVLTNPPFGGREEDGIESNFPKHFQTRETADLFLALIIRLLKTGGRAAVVLPDGSLFGEGVKTRLKEALMEECNLHTIVRLPNSVFKPYASIGTNLLFFEKGEPTKDIWFYEQRVAEGQKAYSMTKPLHVEHFDDCVKWWGGEKRKGRKETEVAWKITAADVKARGYNLDFKNPHTVADDHGDPAELLAKLEEAEKQTATLRDQLKTILAEAHAAMNAKVLLSQIDRLADAPDAAQHLRRFILNLAIRGKLVELDPTDEPADILLQKIRVERDRFFYSPKRKTDEIPISAEEIPFPISEGMVFARLATIARCEKGATPIQRAKPGPYPLVALAETRATSTEYQFDTAAAIVPLISSTGHGHASLKRMHYQEGKFALGNILCAVIPFVPDFVSARYLYEYLWAFKEPLLVDKMLGTANVSLTMGKIGEAPIPIISPRSQTRLIELMALCDRLETSQAERESRRDRLTAASLHRLNQPVNTGHTQAGSAHAHFVLKYLPQLATRSEHIAQLRTTIINLAVRGKLVEQDPKDEPATRLLKRIHTEKLRMVTEGDARKGKPLPALADDDLVLPLPTGWAWSQLAEIGFINPRNSAEDRLSASFIPMAMISAEYGVASTHEVRTWIEIKSGFTHFAEGDIALAKITPCFQNGKSTVLRGLTGGIGAGTTELHVVRPVFINPDYVLIFLKSPNFIETGIPLMTGTAGQKRVSTEYFANSPFPLPPLAEQHRIVAKVDELMALCDRLEASLTTTQTESRRLLEAILHEALTPTAESEAFDKRPSAAVAIAAKPMTTAETFSLLTLLSVRLANVFPRNRTGGDRKRMVKSLAIAQRHLGADFGWNDYQMAAGPHNGELVKRIENAATGLGLLNVEARQHGEVTAYHYKAASLPDAETKRLATFLGDKAPELNRLSRLFSQWTSLQAELYATAYAVWNDLLIDHADVNDAAIIQGVQNWSSEKRAKYSRTEIIDAIASLRRMSLVPWGFGQKTQPLPRGLFDSPEDAV